MWCLRHFPYIRPSRSRPKHIFKRAASHFYNEVQLNAVMQKLCGFIICVKGLLQVTVTSCILVYSYGAALSYTKQVDFRKRPCLIEQYNTASALPTW